MTPDVAGWGMNNTTALGWFVGISPEKDGRWSVQTFGKNGMLRGRSYHTSIEDARAQRKRIFSHHAKHAPKARK